MKTEFWCSAFLNLLSLIQLKKPNQPLIPHTSKLNNVERTSATIFLMSIELNPCHSNLPRVHSQCESKNVRTWPTAAEEPSRRARIRPSRFGDRIIRTLPNFAMYSSSLDFKWSGT
jgi:hypothetical protein